MTAQINRSKLKTRFYNEIAIENGLIRKTSSPGRIRTEEQWFRAAAKVVPGHIPKIYDVIHGEGKSNLSMSYIDADNLYHQYRGHNPSISQHLILDRIAHVCSKMHTTPIAPDQRDIRHMYLEKPLAALEYLYKKYPHLNDSLVINGLRCRPAYVTLTELYEQLEGRLLRTAYSFIHGDLTLSNMIADAHGQVFIFDPRGKFGASDLLGDVRYDTAKLYFSCISNFDSLNNHAFSVVQSTRRKQFSYTIEPVLSAKDKLLKFWLAFPDDQTAIKYIDCSIWLSLFPHLQESDDQTLTAYLHGLYLLESLTDSDKV